MASVVFPVGTTGMLVTALKAVLPALGTQSKHPDFNRKLLVRVWGGRRVEMVAHNRKACFRSAVDLFPGDDLPPCENETVVHVENSSSLVSVLEQAYKSDNRIRVSVEQPSELEGSLFTVAGFDFDSVRFITGTHDLVCPGSGVPPFPTSELFGSPPDPSPDGGFLLDEHTKALLAAQAVVGNLVAYPGEHIMWAVPATPGEIEFEAAVFCSTENVE